MEAKCYRRLDEKVVRCDACAHHCLIKPNHRGFCQVRENQDGRLIVLTDYQSISVAIDPIEKKPLWHFLPKSLTYSFATVGCNMRCPWCQNMSIARCDDTLLEGRVITPKEHVQNALKHRVKSISYTYTEPTIFFEYALETMKEAHRNNLKNVWVSNGMMSACVRGQILPYLDAINIDLKTADKRVYKKYCHGDLDRVMENLKAFDQSHVHLEVTSLIIPNINDSEQALKDLVKLFKMHLGDDVPWHISRFYPGGMMKDSSPTPIERLKRLRSIAIDAGIKHVYLGNV